MEPWYPGATRQAAATKYWGTYRGNGPFKGVLHTTEVKRFPTPGSYYGHTSYPHFTVCLGADGRAVVFQHIPVDRAARALVNGPAYIQTNNDSAIQIEIAWHAADAQNMPKALLDAIGHLMRWLEKNCGIKRKAYDGFHYYLPENGHRLGREPWRMPLDVFDRFDGWLGHQHVPDGNVHGDPGKIDINYLLTVGVPQPVLEDDLMIHSEIVTIPPVEVTPEGRKRQLATLKGKTLMASKVANVSVRCQDGGFVTNAMVQKTEYAGILVLSFCALNGGPAVTGNCWVDVVYMP